MKYLLLIILFSSVTTVASNIFPVNKMICTGSIVNAPDEFHEGYYYIGVVFNNAEDSVRVLNCLGPSPSYIEEKIKNGKCGYSGNEFFSLLEYKKIKNKTIIYNNKQTLKLILGYEASKNIYELDGKYLFWGDVVPGMYYQVNCKALLNQ